MTGTDSDTRFLEMRLITETEMKFSSLAALKFVKMTTSSAASDENFVKMTTFSFQWWRLLRSP